MAETRFWKCDGCGYESSENPETGTFVRFNYGHPEEVPNAVPMMAVVFVDQTGGSHREPEHICLDCYEMIHVTNAGK